MTDDEMITTLQQAEENLKDTTTGYKNHKTSWYQVTTTHWYKGLNAIESVITELKKRKPTPTPVPTYTVLTALTSTGDQISCSVTVQIEVALS